jgi:hypothetical protein
MCNPQPSATSTGSVRTAVLQPLTSPRKAPTYRGARDAVTPGTPNAGPRDVPHREARPSSPHRRYHVRRITRITLTLSLGAYIGSAWTLRTIDAAKGL